MCVVREHRCEKIWEINSWSAGIATRRCINLAGWQKSRNTRRASRVFVNINGHVGSPTVGEVCCTYTRRRMQTTQQCSSGQSEKVPSRCAISCAPSTPFTSCVSRYLPILLRGTSCSWSLQSARGQTSPALEVPLWKCHDRLRGEAARMNKGRTSDGGCVSSRDGKSEEKAVALHEFSAAARRTRAEYFTSEAFYARIFTER